MIFIYPLVKLPQYFLPFLLKNMFVFPIRKNLFPIRKIYLFSQKQTAPIC